MGKVESPPLVQVVFGFTKASKQYLSDMCGYLSQSATAQLEAAIIVVAATDDVAPQTKEHIYIYCDIDKTDWSSNNLMVFL